MDTYCCTPTSKYWQLAVTAHVALPTPSHDEETLVAEELDEPCQLIVYNDDINTFEHVIETVVVLFDVAFSH